MIITCEKCGKSFNLDEKLLKPGGTRLQCSRCKHIFRAFPPGEKEAAREPSGIELIICEQCGAGFNIKSALLKPEGTKVRCSKCKHIFLAFPSSIETESKQEEIEIERPQAAAPEPRKEELDLSLKKETAEEPSGDLDLEIEDESQAAEPSGSSGDLELELDEDETAGDLDLELDEESQAAEPSGSSGDLELGLDEDKDEEIDFSEVDSLLESEDVSAADTVEVSEDELDLDLDDDSGDSGASIEQQEIDLADLEQTIEMELLEPEDDDSKEEPEDVELELADDEAGLETDEELSLDESGEEDFSDIEEMLAAGEDEETIELDLEGEETERQKAAAEGGELAVKDKKVKAGKKKKEKKPLKKAIIIAAIVLVVIIGLCVGGYYVLKTTGFSVMGFSVESLGFGKPVPVGSVRVMENTLQNDFIENAGHGKKLFIIKGSVKNESSEPKGFIKVTANLYSEGHKLEMTSSACCGNILTNEELATSDFETISARMADKAGSNNSNTNVKPGMIVPFMIVFPDFPANTMEYEVLVAESSPVVR